MYSEITKAIFKWFEFSSLIFFNNKGTTGWGKETLCWINKTYVLNSYTITLKKDPNREKQMTEQILVIKHGALGDIVQGFDAFESLRKHAADAQIAVLTGPAFADFMGHSGWFDEILIDRRVSILNVTESWRTLSVLRRKWDKVIDLQCSRRTETYAFFISSGTRWFGTAKGASDPMPDFTGINNRDRMMVAVEQVELVGV